MTARYRFLVYLSGFLLLANLLVMNDFTSLWGGAESWLAWRSLSGESGLAPHELFMGWIMGEGPIPHFWIRLPGVVIFILSLALYWGITQRLFGAEVLRSTLLILSASLLLPNLAKLATGDIWAMASQWLAYALLIRYMKQPSLLWRAAFYLALLCAVWVQPINALIFLMGSSALLYFLHPQGKRLWGLNPWLAGVLAFTGLYFSGMASLGQESFLVGFRTGRFLLWNLIGILPFLGFVLAGLWETAQRLGRREELAILNAAALIFAFVAHSLALQGLLALLAGRQLKNYFDPNYPHEPVVKAGALLHLVAAFCVLTLLMMGSFFQFRALGFRAALAAGGIYWMLSFIAVIGLFGPNRRYLYGGILLGGLLLTTLFWLQLNPLVEQMRGWPRALVEKSRQRTAMEGINQAFLVYRNGMPFPSLAPYSREAYPATRILKSSAELQGQWNAPGNAVFFLERSDTEGLNNAIPADTLRGWDNRLRNIEYVLLVKDGL